MKYANLVKLTVFSHENEDSQLVFDDLNRFFPFKLEENKILAKKTAAEGFNEKRIEIYEVTLNKTKLISQFLKNLVGSLDEEQKKQVLQQVESRLDKNLDFFLRFEKDAWLNKRKLVLTDSGKCFHLKISIVAFPKKREVALNVIKDLFS